MPCCTSLKFVNSSLCEEWWKLKKVLTPLASRNNMAECAGSTDTSTALVEMLLRKLTVTMIITFIIIVIKLMETCEVCSSYLCVFAPLAPTNPGLLIIIIIIIITDRTYHDDNVMISYHDSDNVNDNDGGGGLSERNVKDQIWFSSSVDDLLNLIY